MQRHGDGVIDGEILRHADVVAATDRGGADVRGKTRQRFHDVIRHVARLIVGRLEAFVDANGEDRQIVEEEGIEMIGVEHHDHVGPHRGKRFLLRAEQLGDLAIRAVALDEKRKYRGMRHAETGNDLRHDR
jgi:hypothetical protein